jgi:hypothetical protein
LCFALPALYASWRNFAEIELSLLFRQEISGRIGTEKMRGADRKMAE